MMMLIFMLVIPVAAAVSALVVRWMLNRPERISGEPVTPEELYRERPDSAAADLSYEYLEAVLEQVEDTVDWGFNAAQRQSLNRRLAGLEMLDVASAIFPVHYETRTSDLLMHFMRIEPDAVRCRFEGAPDLVTKIRSLLAGVPQRA